MRSRITGAILALLIVGFGAALAYWLWGQPPGPIDDDTTVRVGLPAGAGGDDKAGGGPSAALPESLQSVLDVSGEADAREARYARETEEKYEEVRALINEFRDLELQEVPADFRLLMQPSNGFQAPARQVHCYSDGEKILLGEQWPIWDLGEVTCSISYKDGEDGFYQTLTYRDPQVEYRTNGAWPSDAPTPEAVYKWQDTGVEENVTVPGAWLHFAPDLSGLASRELKKGDTFTDRTKNPHNVEVDATTTVLGYVESDGHHLVAFEQVVPHESPSVGHVEFTHRMYYDIESKVPYRIEFIITQYWTKENLDKRAQQGKPVSETGIEQNITLFQLGT
ncbi:MAG: hypothetical protein JXR94_04255 [Candidatus Hydrogenedentes bacterium]|nr:hypothetical protein [Candidatus Hydrogenedentota bacterium]